MPIPLFAVYDKKVDSVNGWEFDDLIHLLGSRQFCAAMQHTPVFQEVCWSPRPVIHRCRRPRLFWLKGLDVVESQELKLVGSQRLLSQCFRPRSLPPSLQWNGSCKRTVLSSLSLRSHSSHSHDLIPSSRSLQKRQAKSGAPTKLYRSRHYQSLWRPCNSRTLPNSNPL